jgi:thioredoxin-like negative regulator of GroEL
MKHEVWTDSDVGRAVERSFIPLAIDVDQNPIVAERYAVDGIPTILLLDAEGKVHRRAGFMSREEVIQFLSKGDG